MSDLAVSTPEQRQIAPKAGRRERIPLRIRQAIDLIATRECKTIKAAAEHVGLSYEHVVRSLKTPQAEAYLERKSREIIRRAQLKAAARMDELVDSNNQNVAFNASSFALRTAGIGPDERAQVSVNVGVSVSGYMVDLGETIEATVGVGQAAIQQTDDESST